MFHDMPTTVHCTHRFGQKLSQRDWGEPYAGIVALEAIHRHDLNRTVRYLHLRRGPVDDGKGPPDLWDPQWLTFGSDRGCIVTGFEEIDGTRYYQGWYICWG